MPTQLFQQKATSYINVKDYGAVGNGSADDTAAIAAAISAASTAGGGCVFFPGGTYITGTQTLATYVHLRGVGMDATIIKLKSSTNDDLFSANTSYINLAATFGSSNVGGVHDWGIHDMTLDGNVSGQSSGPSYPLRVYGYAYQLENVVVRNGYSGGMLCDWNGGDILTGEEVECQFGNVTIHDNSGIGFQFGGPHDSEFANIYAMKNISHNVHIAPNASGTLWTGFHGWGTTWSVNAVCVLIETSNTQFYNVVAEASDVAQVVILGEDNILDGFIYVSGGGISPIGLQLGQQSGQTPYPGQIYQSAGVTTSVRAANCKISTKIKNCTGGAIKFGYEQSNIIDALVYQTTGPGFVGSPSGTDTLKIVINGLTPDDSPSKGGQVRFVADSYAAFSLSDGSFDVINVDTHTGERQVQILNGAGFTLYNGNYSSPSVHFNNDTSGTMILGTAQDTYMYRAAAGVFATSGAFGFGTSGSSGAALANNGTISTTAVGVAKVSPTANVTGVILQAGSVDGQVLSVMNKSSFTVTFAVTGTSNIADGSTSAIPANCARIFAWDSNASLWFRAA